MFNKILIANRGEIAIRIAGGAADLGIATVSVYAEDDAMSLHRLRTDESCPLGGSGPAAYLDIPKLIDIARQCGCDAVHPGYGFLSENPEFARRVAAAGICFIGPGPDTLELFGDKAAARRLARETGVSVPGGTDGPASIEEAIELLGSSRSGAIMIKALAGGGGRGMRKVTSRAEVAAAYAACRDEARAAFGLDEVYVEEFIPDARHIEVQVVADAGGRVACVGDRDCSLQRRHQKLVEFAPSPSLDEHTRRELADAARAIASAASLSGVATFEFLVDTSQGPGAARWVFIECNPRLQVEHTVTEMVYGVDLVQLQIQVAAGMRLQQLGMGPDWVARPAGMAVELRVNMEKVKGSSVVPAGGTLSVYEPPGGPGIRVDACGYQGFMPSPSFDSLLAKVIVHARTHDLSRLLNKAQDALADFRIGGIDTNLAFLQAIVAHPQVHGGGFTTGFIEAQWEALTGAHPRSARHYAAPAPAQAGEDAPVDDGAGAVVVSAPMHGRVVSVDVAVGDPVSGSQQLVVIEAMKMHNSICAGVPGTVLRIAVKPGDIVAEGAGLLVLEDGVTEAEAEAEVPQAALQVPASLQQVQARRAEIHDESRPADVARRHAQGRRTVRENIADLCDEGSFMEFGSLATSSMPASRRRDPGKPVPADGLVAGIATIHAAAHPDQARCVVVAFDPTVLAGTLGMVARLKLERLIRIADEGRLPMVIFAEGGGARSGESDGEGAASSLETFAMLARLKGRAPLVGIASGFCFAANAALLGCCDVIIATRNASIGMAGPAMIEGAGLGSFAPEEVGPAAIQSRNGVVDMLVASEAEAVAAARQYIGYFQGDRADVSCADPHHLRHLVPENRLLAYDIRRVLHTLADTGSVTELGAGFGRAIVTALLRVDGIAFGVLANDPRHLGGAIDSDAAAKAARFIAMCDGHGLPLVSLCDTPGFMVGPEAEKTGLVRHVMAMMTAGAKVRTPHFSVVLRKCYGLGGLAMNLGSHQAPLFHVAWPTAEYGAMNPEGSVRIAHRQELQALDTPTQRAERARELIEGILARGQALRAAARGAIDEVIDPADTRRWLSMGARSMRSSHGH